MSVYIVVDIGLNSPSDKPAFGSYVENTNELLSSEGVKVIAFDTAPEVLEGNWTAYDHRLEHFDKRSPTQTS